MVDLDRGPTFLSMVLQRLRQRNYMFSLLFNLKVLIVPHSRSKYIQFSSIPAMLNVYILNKYWCICPVYLFPISTNVHVLLFNSLSLASEIGLDKL